MLDDVRWGGLTLASLNAAEQIPFLKEVLAHPLESRLLKGCAGSGKTLLAAFALDQLRHDGNIDAGFLVFTKLLERFVSDNFDAQSAEYPVDHFHHWSFAPKNRTVYVVDESQDFKAAWIKQVQEHSKSQIWIGDEQQQIYLQAKMEGAFSALAKGFKTSQTTTLTTNYRNSLSIAKYASKFLTLSEDDKKAGVSLDQKINAFILPIIKNVASTRNDPVRLVQANSREQEYDVIAKMIADIQANTSIKSKQIAIAHMLHGNGSETNPDGITLDEIQVHLERRGVNILRIPRDKDVHVLPNFKDQNLVILSAIHSLKGLEVDYVIFPQAEKATLWKDPVIRDNLLFVLFTRPRFQLNCTYVDDMNNYILEKIRSEKALDYVVRLNATDLLGISSETSPEAHPERSPETSGAPSIF